MPVVEKDLQKEEYSSSGAKIVETEDGCPSTVFDDVELVAVSILHCPSSRRLLDEAAVLAVMVRPTVLFPSIGSRSSNIVDASLISCAPDVLTSGTGQ